jgi:fructose-1,6-bisphosphatase I/sedoheptulose-1,7-bisphosphatase
MPRSRTTLTQFLIDERKRFPSASGEFNSLILDVAIACKSIAHAAAYGTIDAAEPLAVRAARAFATALESDMPTPLPSTCARGKHRVLFEPLDGARNTDVDAPLGSIFSVLRGTGNAPTTEDFLRPGSVQVAAGYALYGPATIFVLSVGAGVHAFTLHPELGDFLLTHRDLRVPLDSNVLAVDWSNSRFWDPPVKRYVNECLAGASGARGADFATRWVASTVAEVHRLLLRGGVLLCPPLTGAPADAETPLLNVANPLAYLVEHAGGRASTGREPLLSVTPRSGEQRVGLVFGSTSEVERVERYYAEPNRPLSEDPLFSTRGLFRA